jgi:wolfamin
LKVENKRLISFVRVLFSYEYEITVRMSSSSLLSRSAEIVLRAQNQFGNFTQRLNTSDRIWFKGSLRSFMFDTSTNGLNGGEFSGGATLHGPQPKYARKFPLIQLTAIGCVNCHDAALTAVHLQSQLRVNARMKDLYRGFKYLLNVLFNPLVTFK